MFTQALTGEILPLLRGRFFRRRRCHMLFAAISRSSVVGAAGCQLFWCYVGLFLFPDGHRKVKGGCGCLLPGVCTLRNLSCRSLCLPLSNELPSWTAVSFSRVGTIMMAGVHLFFPPSAMLTLIFLPLLLLLLPPLLMLHAVKASTASGFRAGGAL